MVPTNKHKELCKIAQMQAGFWADSADINSPTHLSDIDEVLNNLDWLSTSQLFNLEYAIKELYFTILDIGNT